MTDKDFEGRSAPDLLPQVPSGDFGAAVPLPLSELDVSGEYFGVKVATMGEDAEEIAAFTHDRRRALAAVHRFIREAWLTKPLRLDLREVRADGDPMRAEQWWIGLDNCGCGDTCPHEPDEEGYRDCSCKSYGLPPCVEEEMSWMGRLVPEGTPGAFPALQFEVVF